VTGRAPSGQALAVPATPANAVDGPSGFDPSRDDILEVVRREFVNSYQYRFQKFSDHYTVVAMFALKKAREALLDAALDGHS
jgi:hypothetical protein